MQVPRPIPPSWHVDIVEATDSTNADLAALARDGAADRTVLVARFQRAGRGRLERSWQAPPMTNLLMSVLLRRPATAEVTQRIGLAAVDAARRAGVVASLKWPNDVLVGAAKLAGILAERGGTDTDPWVVVGLGLNVRWAPPGAARLGDDADPLTVLADVLDAFDQLPVDIDERYRHHLATLGRRVRIERFGDTLVGEAIDVRPAGELLVRTEDGVVEVSVGDVTHLRDADELS